MNYKPLQIGDLIAERPIVQGGMGVGISLGNLAAQDSEPESEADQGISSAGPDLPEKRRI